MSNPDNRTKLDRLEDSIAPLTLEERRYVESHLLGSVSNYIPDNVWDKAIASAIKYVERVA